MEIGNLWFGADIDLTKLKQKIQSGNQSILDALKLDYDTQSYQQMVDKLRGKLGSETFEIKLTANTSRIVHDIQNAAKGGASGTAGLDKVSEKILRQQALVNDLRAIVAKLKADYDKLGGTERKQRYIDARAELAKEHAALSNLTATRREYNRSINQTEKNKRKAERAARDLERSSLRLNTTLAGGIHVSTQLGSALSSLFAVHAARQFLNNVIEIGGQLEKQRISMGAIVGDTARANELFENIKNLAIKSPFGVVELDQYSKQLAAYGIEQSDLFNMTKRLADISAGAGQDISRLALALGHVKSATYLTGITLRQFSMNNIPMLKMLADYYSEVEKRAVSTADVQKRISKRQVSYEDVIEQIKRMTNEGGQFYDMQSKISESLQAKYKNLKDSFDIMYGEIAESGIGDVLKDLAAVLTSMSRNWENAMAIIAAAAAAFGTYRTAVTLVNGTLNNFGKATMFSNLRLQAQNIALGINVKSLKALSAETIRTMVNEGLLTRQQLLHAVASKRLSVAQAELAAETLNVTRAQLTYIASAGRMGLMLRTLSFGVRSLGIALKGLLLNPFTLILTGIMAATEVFMHFKNKSDEAKQSVKDLTDTSNEGFENLGEVTKKYSDDLSKVDSSTMVNGIKEISEALKNYAPNANSILKQAQAIDDLAEKYQYLREELESTKQAYEDVEQTASFVINANNSTDGWFDDSFFENVKDYIDGLHDASEAEQKFFYHRVAISKALDNIANISKEFRTKRYDNEGNLKSLKEQMEILKTIDLPNQGNAFTLFASSLRRGSQEANKALGEWTTALREADEIFVDDVMPDLISFSENLDAAYAGIWGDKWKKNAAHVKTALIEVEKEISKIPNITDKTKNMLLSNIFNKRWKLNIDFNTEETKENLTGWQKEMQDYFDENGIHISLSMTTSQQEAAKQIAEAKKKAQEMADNAGKVLIGIGLDLSNLPDNLPTLFNTPWNSTALQDYKENIAEVKNLAKAEEHFHIISEKNNEKDKNKTDEWLKKVRQQKKELDDFYKIYKRNAEFMSKSDAISKAINSGIFNGKDMPKNIDNYLEVLKKFKERIVKEIGKKPSTERKSFLTDLLQDIDEKDFEINVKEPSQAILKKLEEELKKQGKQWNLYNKILEATGSKEQASNIAFGGLIDFDNFAEQLTDEITKGLKGTKAENISIDTLLGMDEAALKKDYDLFGGIIIKLRELKEAKQQLKEEEVDIFLDALKNAKSLETELAQIKVKYDKVRKTLANDPQLLENANEQQKSEEAKVRWEWFKKSNEDWGRIFSDLDRISTTTLENMLEKLKEQIPYVQDNVEAIKALYEAIDKIQKKVTERSPFDYISNALPLLSGLPKYSRQAKRDGDLLANKELAKLLNVKLGDKVTEKQINDALEGAEADFVKGLDAITKNFKDVQDAIQPVISLFEVLGNTTLGDIFQNGSNALSAASQTTSAMKSLGLGALGPYGAAASAALSITSSLFALHDKNLQKEIDASQARQREMSNLTENIERILNRTLGGQYNLLATNKMISELQEAINNQYAKMPWGEKKHYTSDETKKALDEAKRTNTYYDYTFASMLAQRDEINHQMEAEKKKKKSDATAIQNYKKDLAELDDQIKNFATDMAKALYDIDVKSWASELGNALYEAWQKGEDGAEAFKKKASEIMATVAKNIAITKLIETAMDDTLDVIVKEMERTKGLLDENSISLISGEMAKVSTTLPESFNKLMEGLNEGIKKAGLTDLKELADDTSKSSSNSISAKTLTEQTGDLLASYVNGVRLDVSLIRETQAQQLPIISQSLQRVSALTETQVTHLQQIATNTKRNADAADKIYNIMHKIDIGATKLSVK